ncbi:unnamed protein product [marine sediment metagenome]|uniref:Uncharacterized protein n=1 Tax=marine sediment metagenome TaxID=412755 RepID=X1T3G7_9ZZZZ
MAAHMTLPKAPIPAASDGVAKPIKIDPNTAITNNIGRTTAFNEDNFSPQLALWSGGRAGAKPG